DVVIPDRALPFADSVTRLKIELERDGFAKGGAITTDTALTSVAFTAENRTATAHTTGIRLSFPVNSQYTMTVDGHDVPLVQTQDPDYAWRAEIALPVAGARIEMRRR